MLLRHENTPLAKSLGKVQKAGKIRKIEQKTPKKRAELNKILMPDNSNPIITLTHCKNLKPVSG